MVDSSSRLWSTSFLCVFQFLILLLKPTICVTAAANVSDDGRPDLCKANLSAILPPPYGNLSTYGCSPPWNGFFFRFQDNGKVTTIVLHGKNAFGWVGFGFSKDGRMVGSSAMVGWSGKDGKAIIKQYFLQGLSKTLVVPDKGELQFTDVQPVVVLHMNTIYLAFQVKLAAGLDQQHVILAVGDGAPAANYLTYHVAKTILKVEFAKGSVNSGDINNSNGNLKRNHGILGIIGWGALLPAGAIIARYLKHHDPLWYYLHSSIQFVGFLVAFAGVATGRILYEKLQVGSMHRNIGFFVFVLSILQVMAFVLRPHKDSKHRKYWNWYHHWVGRFALFFGAANIVLGIQIGGGGSSWKTAYGILLAIVLIVVIVLEIFLRKRRSEDVDENPVFQKDQVPSI